MKSARKIDRPRFLERSQLVSRNVWFQGGGYAYGPARLGTLVACRSQTILCTGLGRTHGLTEDEKAFLREQAEELKAELAELEKRLSELEES